RHRLSLRQERSEHERRRRTGPACGQVRRRQVLSESLREQEMDKLSTTNRRSFLKSGALIATPLAVVGVPAAAFADDGSRARLARLEDQRSVEALHRQFMRHLNGAADCSEFVASSDAIDLGEGLRAISEDLAQEPELVLAEDGLTAVA